MIMAKEIPKSFRRSEAYTKEQAEELIELFPEAGHFKERLKKNENIDSLFQETFEYLAKGMGGNQNVVKEFLRRRLSQKGQAKVDNEKETQAATTTSTRKESNKKSNGVRFSESVDKNDKVKTLTKGLISSTVEEVPLAESRNPSVPSRRKPNVQSREGSGRGQPSMRRPSPCTQAKQLSNHSRSSTRSSSHSFSSSNRSSSKPSSTHSRSRSPIGQSKPTPRSSSKTPRSHSRSRSKSPRRARPPPANSKTASNEDRPNFGPGAYRRTLPKPYYTQQQQPETASATEYLKSKVQSMFNNLTSQKNPTKNSAMKTNAGVNNYADGSKSERRVSIAEGYKNSDWNTDRWGEQIQHEPLHNTSQKSKLRSSFVPKPKYQPRLASQKQPIHNNNVAKQPPKKDEPHQIEASNNNQHLINRQSLHTTRREKSDLEAEAHALSQIDSMRMHSILQQRPSLPTRESTISFTSSASTEMVNNKSKDKPNSAYFQPIVELSSSESSTSGVVETPPIELVKARNTPAEDSVQGDKQHSEIDAPESNVKTSPKRGIWGVDVAELVSEGASQLFSAAKPKGPTFGMFGQPNDSKLGDKKQQQKDHQYPNTTTKLRIREPITSNVRPLGDPGSPAPEVVSVEPPVVETTTLPPVAQVLSSESQQASNKMMDSLMQSSSSSSSDSDPEILSIDQSPDDHRDRSSPLRPNNQNGNKKQMQVPAPTNNTQQSKLKSTFAQRLPRDPTASFPEVNIVLDDDSSSETTNETPPSNDKNCDKSHSPYCGGRLLASTPKNDRQKLAVYHRGVYQALKTADFEPQIACVSKTHLKSKNAFVSLIDSIKAASELPQSPKMLEGNIRYDPPACALSSSGKIRLVREPEDTSPEESRISPTDLSSSAMSYSSGDKKSSSSESTPNSSGDDNNRKRRSSKCPSIPSDGDSGSFQYQQRKSNFRSRSNRQVSLQPRVQQPNTELEEPWSERCEPFLRAASTGEDEVSNQARLLLSNGGFSRSAKRLHDTAKPVRTIGSCSTISSATSQGKRSYSGNNKDQFRHNGDGKKKGQRNTSKGRGDVHDEACSIGSYSTWATNENFGQQYYHTTSKNAIPTPSEGHHIGDRVILNDATSVSSDSSSESESTAFEDILERCRDKLRNKKMEKGHYY